MIQKFAFIALLLSLLTTSCQNKQNADNSAEPGVESSEANVLEVIQTTSYTYLRVEKNNEEQWIAISKRDIQPGAVVYYEGGLKMTNFESKELKRTFETVYFVQDLSDSPNRKEMMPGNMKGDQPQKPVLTKLNIKIEKVEGGVTIADLYAKRSQFSGKTIIVKGQVTKVNTGIMGRNWIHIQDGTSDGENFDLTITTGHEPAVGDVVTYSGKLVLNKDFGSGYSYEVIIEEANPLK